MGMYDRELSQRDDKVGAGPGGGEKMCQDEIKTYIGGPGGING